MNGSAAEAQFMAGHEAGREICLVSGTSEPGRSWLAENGHPSGAFISGYEWALFDYEDANGLPHMSVRSRSA